jgi:hypothetical protein
MTIIQRRTFYGKVGAADSLVEWAREMYALIQTQGQAASYRIMTDHLSGRTDRVVVEVEAESLADLEGVVAQAMNDPEMRTKFEASFAKLTGLIDHAEVEHWAVQ